jgi:hypothetical protein
VTYNSINTVSKREPKVKQTSRLSTSSRRPSVARTSGWLPLEQEAKVAQRFFDVAADSSVPWQTFPNSIRIVHYRNGFVVLDADGRELFRKITVSGAGS